MSILQSENLTIGYDRTIVVEELSVSLPAGRITAVVGANGSGKSTLLKAISRVLAPFSGGVYLDGESIHQMPSRALARQLSILPQSPQAPDSLTVAELVSHGRYPHRRWLGSMGPDDQKKIEWALDVVELSSLCDRPVDSLSGGQRQRVWIAMTLAQGAEILLLDEPTSYLDMCHQLEVMELLARLSADQGKTIVMVLHDVNLAARYAGHMILIREGGILAEGSPDEVMTPLAFREAFGVDACITRDPRHGTPVCLAYPTNGETRTNRE